MALGILVFGAGVVHRLLDHGLQLLFTEAVEQLRVQHLKEIPDLSHMKWSHREALSNIWWGPPRLFSSTVAVPSRPSRTAPSIVDMKPYELSNIRWRGWGTHRYEALANLLQLQQASLRQLPAQAGLHVVPLVLFRHLHRRPSLQQFCRVGQRPHAVVHCEGEGALLSGAQPAPPIERKPSNGGRDVTTDRPTVSPRASTISLALVYLTSAVLWFTFLVFIKFLFLIQI